MKESMNNQAVNQSIAMQQVMRLRQVMKGADIARETGVHANTIYNIFRGTQKQITELNALKIYKVFDKYEVVVTAYEQAMQNKTKQNETKQKDEK